jgi:hypothetical protein
VKILDISSQTFNYCLQKLKKSKEKPLMQTLENKIIYLLLFLKNKTQTYIITKSKNF